MKDRKRIEELLNACISYIDSHIESYLDMIDTFKKLGFTDVYKGTSSQNTKMLNVLKGDSGYYSSNYKGLSFVDALKQMGVDSSFENRKVIALNNGISNYKGTSSQNLKLLNLLRNGKLRK